MSSSEDTTIPVSESPAADAPSEPAAPVDDLREGLVERLTELLGDGVVDHHIIPGKDVWIRVTADAWQHTAESVRYTLGCRYFGFLSAIDWMPSPWGRGMEAEVDTIVHGKEAKELPAQTTGYAGGDTRFQVFARVANIKDHFGITLKVDAGDETPSVPTWTKVFAGADWHERETWEMYGIDFVGHPFLRHIYLPGDFEGNPCRKDFPLLARFVKPWPGIVDVEPLPGSDEPGSDTAGSDEPAADASAPEETA